MKKLFIAVAMLVFLIIFLLIKTNRDNYFNTMFNKWDNGAFEAQEGTELMKSFVKKLSKMPEITEDDILNISEQFKVYEWDNFMLIEYIENPRYYGNSAKGSYHIAVHDGKAELIDINGSIQINGVIKISDNLYHMYVTDYKFTNITGVNVFSILINEKSIEFNSIIDTNNLPEGFEIIDSLYYNNSHINYQGLRDEGNEILIKADDSIYVLKLKNDGLYHVIK